MELLRHPRESERLAAIRALRILDTMPESEYDELVRLASTLCGTPIALFSLVDRDRQWFKARHGLAAAETPREYAFCAHAIAAGTGIFEIADSRLDARFRDNPLVTGEPYVIFYAGIPVRDPASGLPVGTLCVIDREPRALSAAQKDALTTLARCVERILESRMQLERAQRAQRRAEHLETLSRALQRIAQIGGWELDVASGRAKCTSQVHAIFGVPPEFPFTLESSLEYYLPEDRHGVRSLVQRCAGGECVRERFRIRSRDDRAKWVELLAVPLPGDDGRTSTIYGTIQDVTEIVEAQAVAEKAWFNAIESSRISSLGEIAAGVAHEINNPLSIISGHARLLAKHPEADGGKVQNRVELILRSIDRIASIVGGLRNLSRVREGRVMERRSLAAIARESIAFVEPRARSHGIELRLAVESEGWVECDVVEIEQVLINLVNNAIDAIRPLARRWVEIGIREEGGAIALTVTDSGRGIPAEVVAKMFQPFYTTKTLGEGKGLGLSICKAILDRHHAGFRYARSSAHTSFEARFRPAAEPAGSRATGAAAPGSAFSSASDPVS